VDHLSLIGRQRLSAARWEPVHFRWADRLDVEQTLFREVVEPVARLFPADRELRRDVAGRGKRLWGQRHGSQHVGVWVRRGRAGSHAGALSIGRITLPTDNPSSVGRIKVRACDRCSHARLIGLRRTGKRAERGCGPVDAECSRTHVAKRPRRARKSRHDRRTASQPAWRPRGPRHLSNASEWVWGRQRGRVRVRGHPAPGRWCPRGFLNRGCGRRVYPSSDPWPWANWSRSGRCRRNPSISHRRNADRCRFWWWSFAFPSRYNTNSGYSRRTGCEHVPTHHTPRTVRVSSS